MFHIDRNPEGDNPGYDAPVQKLKRSSLRALIPLGLDLPRIALRVRIGEQLEGMTILIRYGQTNWSRRRRIPVDIKSLTQQWVDSIAVMCLAHDPKDHAQVEFQVDELLKPLLDAPVSQMKEFTLSLAAALEADERIPYMVWRPYCEMLRKAEKQASRERVIELKTGLAREVAEAVEKDIQPQLIDALIGALQWRNPETLTKIKRAVESGEKPKLSGRQSCLLLEAGGELVML